MPELPEVETIVRGLREKIDRLGIFPKRDPDGQVSPGKPEEFCESLCGRKILELLPGGGRTSFFT